MPLVASTIPNLVSGVSQQPAPSRLRTSGSEMINGYPTVVSGLMKRPPTEFVAKLDAGLLTLSDTTAVHAIDRDNFEKYILVAGESGLALFDQDGNPQTISYPHGTSYLPTADIWRKLRFVTVADTTFVLNTEKVVATVDGVDARPNPATKGTVFIKQAVASVAYAVYVGGVLAGTFTTKDNTTANTALEGTSKIASALAENMRLRGWLTAVAVGATVSFDITEGEVVRVDDEYGGGAMTVYSDTVQAFEDLPPSEIEGRLVKIAGDLSGDAGSSYWVSYAAGIWTEDVGYNSLRAFDPSTMPHVLRKKIDGTFEFTQNEWKERSVGDDDSNPDPTFVGSRLNGLFLFKGRLGFLSEENVILSSVAVFEDLYRTTVVQLLSSDPIDVASATGRVSTLYHAASFSDELVLFSDKQQFRLSSDKILSASTVGITSSTAYPCSLYVAPVTAGASAFFLADGATHTLAREIFIDGSRDTMNGEDIAVQIPSYLPKNMRAVAVSTTADVFLMLSQDAPNELYLHKWYTSDNRKIQSAWCKWVFDPAKQILGMGFLDNYLYMVYSVAGDLRMDRILVGPVVNKEYLLDSQFTDADCSVSGDRFTLPYGWAGDITFLSNATGEPLMFNRVDDTTFDVMGNLTQGFTAGQNYRFLYEFSTQYLREETPEGEGAIQDGRLQMRYYSVLYTNTSYFEAWVTDANGITRTSIFNGRTLDDPDNIANVIPTDTGEFKFPIFGQNEDMKIELVSDQPYRCAFGSVEWTAVYRPKAKRMK